MKTICFVTCVILATPLMAHSQEKMPKAQNLLEEHRRRQKLRELYVAGRVLISLGQAVVVHRFAPEKACHVLQDARMKIKDDPDLTDWTRAALLLLLLDPRDVSADPESAGQPRDGAMKREILA
jgi:hypothetical protein